MPMARRPPTIAQSGWATVKLGIDLGEVFSKGPEQGEDRDFCHFDPISLSCYQSEEANSLARRLPSGMRGVATVTCSMEIQWLPVK
jgi:hypothetical protein